MPSSVIDTISYDEPNGRLKIRFQSGSVYEYMDVTGNVIFGGIVGLAVDAITGGMYKLTPDQIQAELRTNNRNVSVKKLKDGLYLAVVLQPNENWEKIGQLKSN